MSTAMNSAGSSLPAKDDLRVAVAELFTVFQRLFGHRWASTFADAKARPTWLAAFRHAGVTSADIKRGLASASSLPWPPTCGEFAALCNPPAPDLAAAIYEAVRWANGEQFTWSHPAIGAAARKIKSWNIRHLDDREMRRTFDHWYRRFLDMHRRGEPLEVPDMRALPAEIRNTTPPGAPPPQTVRAAIAQAAAALGVSNG